MLTLCPPLKLIFKEETGSTNSDAKEYADAGGEKFTVFWARRQSAGRGRFDRKWSSQSGNLFWSILLPVDMQTPPLSELSFISGLAVAKTVSDALQDTSARVEIKWPNDVLINGKKASGTLIEGSADKGWVVVGIGINVEINPDQYMQKSGAPALYPPTCINDEGGNATVETICRDLSHNLYERFLLWNSQGFNEALRSKYIKQLWNKDETVAVSFDAGKTDISSGINRGIDERGCLLIELESGEIKSIAAADVLFQG